MKNLKYLQVYYLLPFEGCIDKLCKLAPKLTNLDLEGALIDGRGLCAALNACKHLQVVDCPYNAIFEDGGIDDEVGDAILMSSLIHISMLEDDINAEMVEILKALKPSLGIYLF